MKYFQIICETIEGSLLLAMVVLFVALVISTVGNTIVRPYLTDSFSVAGITKIDGVEYYSVHIYRFDHTRSQKILFENSGGWFAKKVVVMDDLNGDGNYEIATPYLRDADGNLVSIKNVIEAERSYQNNFDIQPDLFFTLLTAEDKVAQHLPSAASMRGWQYL